MCAMYTGGTEVECGDRMRGDVYFCFARFGQRGLFVCPPRCQPAKLLLMLDMTPTSVTCCCRALNLRYVSRPGPAFPNSTRCGGAQPLTATSPLICHALEPRTRSRPRLAKAAMIGATVTNDSNCLSCDSVFSPRTRHPPTLVAHI